jgi:hypothetical protein
MKDMKGFAFNEGCKVARAVMWGKSPKLDICTVTKIKDGKIYLDDSKQAIRFPERLLIINKIHCIEWLNNTKKINDSIGRSTF